MALYKSLLFWFFGQLSVLNRLGFFTSSTRCSISSMENKYIVYLTSQPLYSKPAQTQAGY